MQNPNCDGSGEVLKPQLDAPTHTPGPWRARDYLSGDDYTPTHCAVIGPNGIEAIADCFYGLSDGERLANARLIASAPNLLAALERSAKLICSARQYFPKSVKNSDKFNLELTCAEIGKAIDKAKGAT